MPILPLRFYALLICFCRLSLNFYLAPSGQNLNFWFKANICRTPISTGLPQASTILPCVWAKVASCFLGCGLVSGLSMEPVPVVWLLFVELTSRHFWRKQQELKFIRRSYGCWEFVMWASSQESTALLKLRFLAAHVSSLSVTSHVPLRVHLPLSSLSPSSVFLCSPSIHIMRWLQISVMSWHLRLITKVFVASVWGKNAVLASVVNPISAQALCFRVNSTGAWKQARFPARALPKNR